MAGSTVVIGDPSHEVALRNLGKQINNIVVDLETLRAAVSAGGVTLVNELATDHATLLTWQTEVDGDENNIANQVDSILTPDGVVGGSYAFSAGAAATLAASGWVKYRISGIEYTATMPATITLQDRGNVTQGNFSIWRIEIDRLGAVTASSGATVGGRSSAELAFMEIGALAPTASACTIGYLSLTDSDSIINIGTDNLNAAGVTSVIYYERGPRKRISGLNAAFGAVSTLTAASTTYGHGTYDLNVNGAKVAQIAAGAAVAITAADTITTLKYGAVLVTTNLAGTGIQTRNASGASGPTLMAYDSAALAIAAAGDVCDRMPAMFVPLSLIVVNNQSAGTFTFKTDNWDAAGVTSTITDAAVAGWNRTVPTGFDSHQISRVAIPADIAAPLLATLSAVAASTTAVDAANDMTAAAVTMVGS